MSRVYVTRQGDMVDEVCRRVYGREAGAAEAVYAANPGLADFGPRLAAGVRITLPDLDPAPAAATVRLWD